MESLIDIYLYILHTHTHTNTHTQWHSWTEDDRSCDAGDRDSLLSSRKGGKDGRWREWMREKCVGGWLPRSLSLPHTPPCLSLSLHPPFPPSNPQRCTLAWNMGARTHTQVCVSVCLCMWTCETTEQKRQTDRHACEVAVDTASRYTSAFISL